MRITQREWQVIEYVRQGFSDKEIAVKLGISARTIDTHITHIKYKLNADCRISMLYNLGLIRPITQSRFYEHK